VLNRTGFPAARSCIIRHDAGRGSPLRRRRNGPRLADRRDGTPSGGRCVVARRVGSASLNRIRAFFAVDLTDDVRARLARVIASGKSHLADDPIRWVRAETLHLTLRFLGETGPETIEAIRQDVQRGSMSWRSFDLEVRGLGCFPDPQRPRVIWAGSAEKSGAVATIAADLEQIARRQGLPAEDRRFSAHLTIGRVKDRLSPEGANRLSEFLGQSAGEAYGIVPVRSIELLRSDLKPSGPVYTRLAIFALPE